MRMKHGNERLSDDRLISKTFFALLPYQILMIAINAVNGIVDSLYASNAIGEAAMGAIGLFAPVNHFLYAASMMLVSGSQILYGRYISTDRKRVQSVFSVDLLVSLAGAGLLTVLMALGATAGWTAVFTREEPVLSLFNQYLLGQAVGMVPLILGQQLFAFLSLENRSKRTMAASIACFAVNAVMDHLLIVVLDMGIFGLGLASAISFWVFFGVQAAYYLTGRSEWRLSLRNCVWKDVSAIIRLGHPGALSRFVEMFRGFIVNFLLLSYVGSAGLAAFAASNSLLAIIWALPFGMVAVTRMILSINYGEEDSRSMIDVMRVVLIRGTLIMVGVAAALALLSVPLTRLFYQNPAEPVFDMTVMGFRILPWCMPPAVFSLVFASYVQVMEKRVFSIVLPVTDGMAGVVLFSLILIPVLGMNGLYIANILNGVLCAALIAGNAWIERKRFPRSIADCMAIPDSFGVSEDRRMDITVRTTEEAARISEKVMAFCREKDFDSRRAYLAGLCLEEMAGNVVEHGFTKDHKVHSVDIRLSCKKDEIILRVRDDCVPFNPYERISMDVPEENFRNAGIRLVYSIAKDVHYQRLLKHNVLTIHL